MHVKFNDPVRGKGESRGREGFGYSQLPTYNRNMAAAENTAGLLRSLVGAALPPRIALLLLACVAPVAADTIYKTVDEHGVVSYTDTPPVSGEPVETLEIEVGTAAAVDSAQAELQALRETTDRMVADRLQREKHRAEMRQQQVASVPRTQVIEYVVPPIYSTGYPVYYPYPVYCPGDGVGGCRPVPVPPGSRPPRYPPAPTPLPQQGIISPGYDYPASLVRRGYDPAVRAAIEK